MKIIKQSTTILLIVAILTALFILPAAAEGGADASAAEVVFVTDGNRLSSIDFSPVIRDNTTIRTGNLVLLDESGKIRRHARFDEKQNGAAVFGVAKDDGSFTIWPLDVTAIDNTFCLRPESENENLFDDVDSFTFAMHDILANAAEAEIRMVSPTVTVTKADGELVKEMTLDFSARAYADTPMYLNCAYLSQTLTLSVCLSGILEVVDITLQPTAYDAETGVLTVSVRNTEGQEGCTLFDYGMTMNDYPMTVYMYRLRIPCGMFYSSRNEKIRSAENNSSNSLNYIKGMPVRIGSELKIPSWITALEDRMVQRFHSVKAGVPIGILFVVPILLFQIPALIRADLALFNSLKDYDFKLSSVNWINVLSKLIHNIFG